MNRILVFLILLAYHNNVYGQQTILITKDRDNYYEEYSVLKSDKKIRHGRCLKLSKPLLGGYSFELVGNYSDGLKDGYWETYYENINNIRDKGFYKNDIMDSIWVYFYPEGIRRNLAEVESDDGLSLQVVNANPIASKTGRYKNGELSGVWEYFDQRGVIYQKFDHDNDSLIFFNNADINNIEAGFIGGEFLLRQHLYDVFDFYGTMSTINSKIALQPTRIVLRFTIDEEGRLSDVTELENTANNKKISARAWETTQSLDALWYPGKNNGIPQITTKTIIFKLDVNVKYETRWTENTTFSGKTKGLNFTIEVE